MAFKYPLKYSNHWRHNPHTVVTHCMGEFIDDGTRIYTAYEWLDKLGLCVHVTISPSGIVCEHYDFERIGAHAKGHNTGTIGVEFLVKGVYNHSTLYERIKTEYLTPEQWKAGLDYYRKKFTRYKHVRHSDIDDRIDARGEKVKQDPGEGFPWQRFLNEIKHNPLQL